MRGRVHGRSAVLRMIPKTEHSPLAGRDLRGPAGAEDSQIQLKTVSLTYLKPSNLVQMRSDVWIRKAATKQKRTWLTHS